MDGSNVNEEEDDRDSVAAIQLAVEAHPLEVVRLAELMGTEPTNRLFRIALWHAMDSYRDRTGVHLRMERGVVRACTPAEQIADADKRLRTAAARTLRAGRMVEPILGSGDHDTRRRAERWMHRHASTQAVLDATHEEERRQARIAAAIRRSSKGDKS